jgi:hypothetical protein
MPMLLRAWIIILFALAVYATGPAAAWAQAPANCAAGSQIACEDPDVLALETERAALIAQLSGLDPQNATLASEQTWIDGLAACGDDIACYRTAYLNHNQTLRQSVAALPGASDGGAPLEPPAAAPSVEEETSALDEAQEEILREAAQQERSGNAAEAYVPTSMPGWGFFTVIGVTLFVFWRLMRALARNRREVRAAEARLRGRP